MSNSFSPTYNRLIPSMLAGVALLIWGWSQISFGANMNIAWLTIAGERFLEGATPAQAFYETNPPLSVLIYIPAVWISSLFGLSVIQASFIYSCLLTALSIATTGLLLKATPNIDQRTKSLFIIGYSAGVILIPGYFFGDREHILVLGLVPYALVLYAPEIQNRLPPRFLYPVLCFWGFALLIKPQYLFIPSLFFLARMIQNRGIRHIFEPAYLTLACMAALYVAILWFVFPGYMTLIFPEVMTLYIDYISNYNVMFAASVLALPIFCLGFWAACISRHNTRIIWTVLSGAVIGLVSFWLQNKGFYYHLIPTLIFVGMALTLLIGITAPKIPLLLASITALLFGTALHNDLLSPALYPERYEPGQSQGWPTHQELQSSKLVGLIERKAAEKPYFMLASMPLAIVPAVYTDSEYASRFPALWFLPYLIHANITNSLPEKELLAYRRKYGQMIAGDLEKYKPEVVLIGDYKFARGQTSIFDFKEFFEASKEFASQWSRYTKTGQITLNPHNYYRGYQYGNARKPKHFIIYQRLKEK